MTERIASWRLITTLSLAGALAGLLLVTVFEWAEPRIEAHRAAVLEAAIQNVLAAPARYDTLYVVEGGLQPKPPAGEDVRDVEQVYIGYDESDLPVGFAVTGEQPGYQDVIRLIFGYDATSREVTGMQILESKETPGLGDKIEKDEAFVSEFKRVSIPVLGVKAGTGQGHSNEVDMITGATISSRAVIEIINQRLERLEPMFEEYRAVTQR